MKQILSMILVLTLIVSLSAAAFADGGPFGGRGAPGGMGGGTDKSGDAELQAMIAEVAPLFSVDEYTDAETGLALEYNVYLPEGKEPKRDIPSALGCPFWHLFRTTLLTI